MNNFLEKIVIWADRNPIVFATILVELLLVFYIIQRIKEKHDQKKIDRIEKQNAKMRRLDRELANPVYLKRTGDRPVKCLPYESIVHEFEGEEKAESGLQVERAISGPLLSENYLVYVGNGITFGRGEDCGIRIPDPDVSHYHCRLLQDKEELLIEKIDTKYVTVIERGMRFYKLSEKKLKLQVGDKINIGGSIIEIDSIRK